MSAVRERCAQVLARGGTVLNSMVGLLKAADFVLIQRNPLLLKENFDPRVEVDAAMRLGKPITYIEIYLSEVLSCDETSI